MEMSAAAMDFTWLRVLLLLFGALFIAGLGLLIYSIVAKRYWLTAVLLLLPLGLIVLLIPYQTVEVANTSASAHERQIGHRSQQGGFNETAGDMGHSEIVQGNSGDHGHAEATGVHDVPYSPSSSHAAADIGHSEIVQGNSGDHGHAEATGGYDGHPTNYEYSPSEPLTADIYPSLALCARPLAFQLATNIRDNNHFSPKPKFAIQFAREDLAVEKQSRNDWQPTKSFLTNFQKELRNQFPGSSFVTNTETNRVTTSQNLKKLNIHFSHTSSKVEPSSGSIQANWSINQETNSKISVNYAEKRWVTNPKEYANDSKPQKLVVGFTQRLARNQSEALAFAMQDATRQALSFGPNFAPQGDNAHNDVFIQKISKPYGELWQAAILVPVAPISSNAKNRTRTSNTARQQLTPQHSSPHLASHVRATQIYHTKLPRKLLLLTIMATGAFGVAWFSNLLTQGYYRQTINYTLVTTIAVIAGLLILMLSLGSFGVIEIAVIAGLLILILVLRYFT